MDRKIFQLNSLSILLLIYMITGLMVWYFYASWLETIGNPLFILIRQVWPTNIWLDPLTLKNVKILLALLAYASILHLVKIIYDGIKLGNEYIKLQHVLKQNSFYLRQKKIKDVGISFILIVITLPLVMKGLLRGDFGDYDYQNQIFSFLAVQIASLFIAGVFMNLLFLFIYPVIQRFLVFLMKR